MEYHVPKHILRQAEERERPRTDHHPDRIEDPKPCQVCKGEGEVVLWGKVIPCKFCKEKKL